MDTTDPIESAAEGLLAAQAKHVEPEETQDDLAPEDEPEGDEPEDEGQAAEPEGDEEEPEDSPPEEPLISVKIDGEEKKVTLDELKRGYAGQGYIQNKMQESAAARKQAEEAFHALNAERESFAQFLQTIDETKLQEPTPPPAELAQTDIAAYLQEKAVFEEENAAYQAQKAQIDQQLEQHTRIQQQVQQQNVAQQRQRMTELIPELGDAEKAPEHFKKLIAAGRELGYSEQELSGITDARAVYALDLARQFLELRAGIKTTTDKKPNPVVKPGTKAKRRSPDQSRAKQLGKLQTSRSTDDAVAFLLGRQNE